VHSSIAEFERLAHDAIASYSPSLTRAIVWRLLDDDEQRYWAIFAELMDMLRERLSDPDEFRRLKPLYEGVPEMLAELVNDYPLAIVSQNFSEAEQWLEVHGIRQHFTHLSVSLTERLYKPDPRLYLTACDALAVSPRDVVMVGDRLDNDIWPANRLRMVSVRVLTGIYSQQQPRYHLDVPNYTLRQVTGLPPVLDVLAG
jgi:HAD superfamily hydrolase (TIGR01549 family)